MTFYTNNNRNLSFVLRCVIFIKNRHHFEDDDVQSFCTSGKWKVLGYFVYSIKKTDNIGEHKFQFANAFNNILHIFNHWK